MRNKDIDVFTKIKTPYGDPAKCWEWEGLIKGRKGQERPVFSLNGKTVNATRLVYELIKGEKIPDNLLIRHTCDNELCVNTAHMILGTHEENMQDMSDHERNGLSAATVRAIKRLLSQGRPHLEIANLYGLPRGTVTNIATGRTYKRVTL